MLLAAGAAPAQTAGGRAVARDATDALERLLADAEAVAARFPGADADLDTVVATFERLAAACRRIDAAQWARCQPVLNRLGTHVRTGLGRARGAGPLAARVQRASAMLGSSWARWGDDVQARVFDLWLRDGDVQAVWANLEERARQPGDAEHRRRLHRDRGEAFVWVGMLDPAAAELQAAQPATVADDPRWHVLDLDRLLMAEAFERALARTDELQRDHAALFAAPERRNRLRLCAANALQRLQRGAESAQRLQEVLDDDEAPPSFRERATALLATIALDEGRRDDAHALLSPWLADAAAAQLLGTRLVVARHQLEGVARGELGREVAAAWQSILEAEFRDMCAQWRVIPPQPGGMAFLQLGMRRDLLCQLWRAVLATDPEHGPARCLQAYLEAESLGSLARARDLAPGSVAAVQARLVPPRGVLLVYLPAPLGSAVLVVTATAVRAHLLPGDVGLRAAVRSLREALARGTGVDAADVAAAAGPVADRVLPAAVRDVVASHETVAIAGRELLSRLPFEALPWPEPAAPWLGLARALAHLPSLPLALHTAAAPPAAAQHDLAIVAAGAAGGFDRAHAGLPPLPLDDRSLRALTRSVAAERCTTRAGSGREGLRELAAACVGVLFAHGVSQPEFPFGTGVLLSGDDRASGAVFAADLGDLDAAAQLVVLCACSTGRSSVLRGDAGMDFGNAWLWRGARAVIQADGDLMLEPTRRLVAALLDELAQGSPPAAALRSARCRVYAGDGPLADRLFPLLHLDGLGFEAVAVEAAARAGWLAPSAVLLAAAVVVWLAQRRRCGRRGW